MGVGEVDIASGATMSDSRVEVVSREAAAELVSQHTFRHKQYAAVSHESAKQLLGGRFDLMMSDPIRKYGPMEGTVYPWNVIDYLSQPPSKKTKG